MYQGHSNETTPMVYAADTRHYVVEIYTKTSKYYLAQNYM